LKKIIVSIIFILALVFSSGQALAWNNDAPFEETERESEMLLNLFTSVTPALSVSNTTATFMLSVTCISSVNSINATLQIQQWNGSQWDNYGSPWKATSSTSLLNTSGTRTVAKGHTYRLKVTVSATSGITTGTVIMASG